MYFDPTAINFTSLIFIVFAVWTITAVSQRKADHNLPLIFYFVTLAFNRSFERGLNVELLLVSAAIATIIRFEFLSTTFIKWFSYLEMLLLVGVVWNLLQVIFGPQMALRI